LTGLFTEVKRQKPSVIFIPNVDTWYATLAGPALTAFLGMLRLLHPTDPIMVLGTAETEFKNLDSDLKRDLFGFSKGNSIEIARPIKVSLLMPCFFMLKLMLDRRTGKNTSRG